MTQNHSGLFKYCISRFNPSQFPFPTFEWKITLVCPLPFTSVITDHMILEQHCCNCALNAWFFSDSVGWITIQNVLKNNDAYCRTKLETIQTASPPLPPNPPLPSWKYVCLNISFLKNGSVVTNHIIHSPALHLLPQGLDPLLHLLMMNIILFSLA